MKIGILFGPSSGSGFVPELELSLASRLEGHEVAVCRGRFGGTGRALGWAQLEPGKAARGGGYVGELFASVEALGDWRAELLLCVGGDGLASYAADAMLSGGRPMMLVGIGTGTINVGPIVRMGAEAIGDFDPAQLVRHKVGAVEVLVDGAHLAYAFNDAVLGDTFLGTVDGKVVTLSVDALLEGKGSIAAEPSGRIAGPGFAVSKNGLLLEDGVSEPRQMVVSPLGSREFFARAIAGALCEAPYLAGGAALALFDCVIVRAGAPERGWSDFVHSAQLLFGPGDLIEVEGLAPEARMIVDGNPFAVRSTKLGFRSLPELVDVGGC